MTPPHPPKVKYSRTVMVKEQQQELPTSKPCSCERRRIPFEYVKGIKNTLTDTMGRLVQLDPAIKQEPEPEEYQFDQPLKKEQVEEAVATIWESTDSKNEPIPPNPKVTWGVASAELKEMQSEDKLCARIMSQMAKQGEKALNPYYLKGGILKKYVYEAKQWFETIVVP